MGAAFWIEKDRAGLGLCRNGVLVQHVTGGFRTAMNLNRYALLLLFHVVASPVFAAAFYVVDGAAEGGDGAAGSPFNSIRAALNAANANGATNNIIMASADTFNDADENFTASGQLIVSNLNVRLYGGFVPTSNPVAWCYTDSYGAGSRTGTTTIDAENRGRLMQIVKPSTNALVNGFVITRAGAPSIRGAAIEVNVRSRLAYLDVFNCVNTGTDTSGTIRFQGTGGSADGSVLEYSSIHDNTKGRGTGIEITGGNNVLVANCRFSKNFTTATSAGGGGIYGTTSFTVFGCLFYGNDATNNQGAAVAEGYSDSNANMYFMNCTVADNGPGRPSDPFYFGGGHTYIRNCVFANNGGITNGIMESPANVKTWGIGKLMVCSNVVQSRTGLLSYETATVTNNPLFTTVHGQQYTLGSGSPAIDAGGYLIATNSAILGGDGSASVKFVDVNKNGTYDVLTDIVVDLGGFNASGLYEVHHIYTRDLAGRQRVKGATIDLGALEYSPPGGTVITLK